MQRAGRQGAMPMSRLSHAKAAVFALIALAPALSAAIAEEKSMQRTITVSATGNVAAAPDQARVNSGVVSEAATAREALDANTAAMAKVIAAMKSAGVDAKDIQTSNFSIEPVTVYDRDGQQPPRVTGYRVSNQAGVLVRDLGKLGATLDALVTAGANQSGGLEFEVSKADELKDEARKDAVATALRRAKLLAQAAGAEIGEVLQISEETSFPGPRPMAFARAAKSDSVPIEAGTSLLEVRVTLTWALK